MYESKILCDSVAQGKRLTTVQTTIPRFVLSEFNTHRDFSRNSASSRAIPVLKNIEKVLAEPFVPEDMRMNKKGMQEGDSLAEEARIAAKQAWMTLMHHSIEASKILAGLEVHKHWANRPLELFNGQTIIVTATRWANFYALRNHPDAAPEMRKVAQSMLAAMEASTPTVLEVGDWHLPLVTNDDRIDSIMAAGSGGHAELLVKLSVARCARVSALTHDGKRDPQADLDLYERLASRGHMSPLEHAAKVATSAEIRKYALYRCVNPEVDTGHIFTPESIGNFDVPWLQHRKMVPGEAVFSG